MAPHSYRIINRGLSARIANRRLEVFLKRMRALRLPSNEECCIHEIDFGDENVCGESIADVIEVNVGDAIVHSDGMDVLITNNVSMEDDESNDAEDEDEDGSKDSLSLNDKQESKEEDGGEDDDSSVPWDMHRCGDCVHDDESLDEHPCAECDCAPCLWDKYGPQLRAHMTMEYSTMMNLRYRCVVKRENAVCSNAHKYWLTYLVPGEESYHGTYIPQCVMDGILASYPAAASLGSMTNY